MTPEKGRVRACVEVTGEAIMILARTYLRAHWLSDTFGSLAVGAGFALLLWWWFTPKLAAERRGPGGRSLDSTSTANHDHA